MLWGFEALTTEVKSFVCDLYLCCYALSQQFKGETFLELYLFFFFFNLKELVLRQVVYFSILYIQCRNDWSAKSNVTLLCKARGKHITKQQKEFLKSRHLHLLLLLCILIFPFLLLQFWRGLRQFPDQRFLQQQKTMSSSAQRRQTRPRRNNSGRVSQVRSLWKVTFKKNYKLSSFHNKRMCHKWPPIPCSVLLTTGL